MVIYKCRKNSNRLEYTRPYTEPILSDEKMAEVYPERPKDTSGYIWLMCERTLGILEWVQFEVDEHKPTRTEQEAHRASSYRELVDPITCEIQRLRDMGGTAEEIAEAEARRIKAVNNIRKEYPYPEETN